MRVVAFLLSLCLLLPLTGASAGKVKTIDGKQMAKDSAAEFYLSGQIGKRFADSILFVYTVKIDTVSASEVLYGSEDTYSIVESPNTDSAAWAVGKALFEFSDVQRARKVYLTPGEHALTMRGVARLRNRIAFTMPFPLSMRAEAGQSYRLKMVYADPIWHISIEDKSGRTVAATKITTSK